MTLLDAPAEIPNKSRPMAIAAIAFLAVAIIGLWLAFRYYPEKRTAERFFDALVAGDTTKAYALWKPGPSYQIQDFLADWGPNGYYGPVKSYKILKASSPRGANAVAIRVAVSPFSPMPDISDAEKSRKTRVVTVWVLTSDKSFSFPP
ncbi:MAG TPA: hypothetical protein VOA64_13890 [Candidatus Dormibacteraeota bacterium]|nr:hypothetical protein [Candidatus Dormibacteraeota bacterium]